MIRAHQDFQGRHYYHHFGGDPNARDQYDGAPWFALAAQFADEWDQIAFDPDYDTLPLEHFEPLVRSAPRSASSSQGCGSLRRRCRRRAGNAARASLAKLDRPLIERFAVAGNTTASGHDADAEWSACCRGQAAPRSPAPRTAWSR